MKRLIIALIVGCVAATAGVALAHTACCEGKACPAGETAVAGATPADAQCCGNVDDATTCHSAPNAGWACDPDPASHIQRFAGHQVIAGCDQVEQANVCIGGSITQGGPSGCVGLGVQFVAGANPAATAEDCTNAAVDACCAADGCVLAPNDGD